ncbi:hypothetical protein HG536_0A04210 [Torulaspora globosa]|uniref:Uncharacterized protein n=1 Tax=Torulaspora globosa TaxID=48254 RepID=A0A7G3ZAR7_9SACH|nr:uncharacterized protein HG536_0A04210 [Torulaspora globosa]QLL30603.1 hypothetical protein HG536_0A04210 [Torulaspora globosa]
MDIGIFERAVQDPCSEECDCEDDDPLHEEQEQEKEVNRCSCTRQDKPPKVGLQRAITTNSIIVSPRSTHILAHSRTAPSPMLSRPSRSRASSTSLIRHFSASEGDERPGPLSRRPSCPTNPSRSSCCGIPTHLYGLEKYVSSALDALSAGDYGFHRYGHTTQEQGGAEAADLLSSSSSSSPSRASVSPSELCQSSASTVSRTQFAKRARKKSFIEISLAKSFSQ